MKKTEITFILDRSGSMRGLEKDTIGGYNGFIEKQLKENNDDECTITTYLFSSHYKLIEEDTPLRRCKELDEDTYYVGGCTALLDTVGTAIEDSNRRNRLKKDVGRIFVIITDGLENASSDYSLKRIQNLVKDAEEDGAKFFFLGADIDAFEGARSIGIKAQNAGRVSHDSKGILRCFRSMNKVVKSYRKEGYIPKDWADDLN